MRIVLFYQQALGVKGMAATNGDKYGKIKIMRILTATLLHMLCGTGGDTAQAQQNQT